MCQYFAGKRRRALPEVKKEVLFTEPELLFERGLIKFRNKFFVSQNQPTVPKNEIVVFAAMPSSIFTFPTLLSYIGGRFFFFFFLNANFLLSVEIRSTEETIVDNTEAWQPSRL